jgi:UDP-N-acetylenolpyruvoylglucosamine reductase
MEKEIRQDTAQVKSLRQSFEASKTPTTGSTMTEPTTTTEPARVLVPNE